MMMWTSIPFFLIVALVLYSLIRMIISEAGIRREVAKPPQCGSCKHQAPPSILILFLLFAYSIPNF
jgi:hypothetical protein